MMLEESLKPGDITLIRVKNHTAKKKKEKNAKTLKTIPLHLFNHQEHVETKLFFPQGLWTQIKYLLYCIFKMKNGTKISGCLERQTSFPKNRSAHSNDLLFFSRSRRPNLTRSHGGQTLVRGFHFWQPQMISCCLSLPTVRASRVLLHGLLLRDSS